MATGSVLLITADQWRGDCLSALGHEAVSTPRLDRLAREGTLFARHFANASPCGPARACLLTGLYLQNHRSVRNGTPLDRRHTTLALEARRAGLSPALFGYTDTSADPRGVMPGDPVLSSYEGVAPGFEPVCLLTESAEPWRRHLRKRGHDLPASMRDLYVPTGDDAFGPAVYGAADSDTAFLADSVLDWLEERRGRPFFAHVSFIRPHPPWVAPAPYHAAADSAAVAAPRRAADWRVEAALHPWLDWRLSTFPDRGWIAGHALDARTASDERMRRLRGVYYGLISEVDAQIGRILDRLDDLGRREETLVVVTADHGEMLGDHGLLGKEGWFDQAFHIPLIVRAPGCGGSAPVTDFTEQVDIMPTVLDWLGVPVPRACDGLSLLPWVRGVRPGRWRREAHWEFDFRDPLEGRPETALGLAPAQCCLNVVRGPRWKYVHFAGLPPLLFDLENDPWETINLYPDPQYRVVALECAGRLLSWRMTHDEAALTATLLTAGGPIESAFENDRIVLRRH